MKILENSKSSAADFLPAKVTLHVMQAAVQKCHGCDLYQNASQAVFGEGPQSAAIVLIGEQPGDEEDQKGHPFIGPAGRLLDRALEEAGFDQSQVYITNAVKHFKFEERGERQVRKKPSASEIRACRPSLEQVRAVRPSIIVCLGATAAQSMFGPAYRVTKERGRFVEHEWAKRATSTIHPSAILRAPDDEQRRLEYERFVEDLRNVRAALA